eukprot:15353877-Ditylum_brightwellii.AAC.1
MHKSFFGHRKLKDGTEDNKRRVDIYLLFNGLVDGRNKLRKLTQNEALKVTEVIRDKTSQEIEVSIVNEPAFKTESERRK